MTEQFKRPLDFSGRITATDDRDLQKLINDANQDDDPKAKETALEALLKKAEKHLQDSLENKNKFLESHDLMLGDPLIPLIYLGLNPNALYQHIGNQISQDSTPSLIKTMKQETMGTEGKMMAAYHVMCAVLIHPNGEHQKAVDQALNTISPSLENTNDQILQNRARKYLARTVSVTHDRGLKNLPAMQSIIQTELVTAKDFDTDLLLTDPNAFYALLDKDPESCITESCDRLINVITSTAPIKNEKGANASHKACTKIQSVLTNKGIDHPIKDKLKKLIGQKIINLGNTIHAKSREALLALKSSNEKQKPSKPKMFQKFKL